MKPKKNSAKKIPRNATVIRILCIDPAITVCGWSIVDVHITSNLVMLNVIKYGCIKSAQAISRKIYREEVEKFNKRLISLTFLRNNLDEIMVQYQPQYIVTEGAFHMPGRTNAFVSLTSIINTMELHCFDKYQLPLFRVAPKSAKETIAATGTAGKQTVIEAVLGAENIKFKYAKHINQINEHEADSVSIGYHFALHMLPALMHS